MWASITSWHPRCLPTSTLPFHVSPQGESAGLQLYYHPCCNSCWLATPPPIPPAPRPRHGRPVRRGRLIILWWRYDLFHQCQGLQLITDEMDLIWTLTAGQTPAWRLWEAIEREEQARWNRKDSCPANRTARPSALPTFGRWALRKSTTHELSELTIVLPIATILDEGTKSRMELFLSPLSQEKFPWILKA